MAVPPICALHLSAKLLAAFGRAKSEARILQTRLVWRLLSVIISLSPSNTQLGATWSGAG